jgi:O-antigen/teichoic acid export membrane protein
MTQTPALGPTPVTNRDFAKGAGTTVLARLGAVFEVVSQPLYVLMFGLAGYGLYAVLWAVVTLVENIADLGMPAALQRVVPQSETGEAQTAALRAALILGVTPSIGIAFVASLCAPLIAPLFNVADADADILVHAIAVYVWTLPLWAFAEISTAALRSKRMFGAEIRLRLVWEQLIRLAIAVMLFLAGFGTIALLYAHLISLFLICILAVRLLSSYFDLRLLLRGPHKPEIMSNMLKSGLAVLPGNIVGRVFTDGPALLLNWLLPGAAGAVSTALYVIARKVSSIVQLVRQAFGYVLAPLASSASQGAEDEVRTIYGFVTRLSFALALPIGAVIIGGGPAVLRAFGTDAGVALPALIILTAARIIEAVIGSASPIQQVTAGFRSQLVGSVVGLGVASAIVFALMPAWGVTGMALAVGAGVAVSALVPLWQLHILDRLHPFAPPFVSVMVKSLLIAVGTVILAHLALQLPTLFQLPVMIIVQLAALWLSARFSLPHEDRMTLGKAARKLKLV